MLVERDDHGEGLMLPGVSERLPDDLLMPQMDTIEYSDGHADFSACWLQIRRRMNYVHAASLKTHGGERDTELL
jgi:hypothetical protein